MLLETVRGVVRPEFLRGLPGIPWWLFFFTWFALALDHLSFEFAASKHTHHHRSDMASWMLMVWAMMLPMLSGTVRWLQYQMPKYLHVKATLSMLAGYHLVWLVLGILFLLMQYFLLELAPHLNENWLTPLAYLGAGLYVHSMTRKKALMACSAGMPLSIQGWAVLHDALVFGIRRGVACALTCYPLMLAMMLTEHALWMMLLLTIIMFYERQRFPAKSFLLSAACYIVAAFYLFNGLI